MSALQFFGASERSLAQTRDRLTTGLKINGARDDGGGYAIAQSMRAQKASFGVAVNAIDRAIGIVSTALAASEAISDTLIDMKRIVLAASDTSVDQASLDALSADYFRLADLVWSITTNASFAGVNLLDAGQPDLVVLAGKNPADTITVAAEDLSDNGPNLDLATSGSAPYGQTVFPGHTVQAQIDFAQSNIENVNAAAARLGTALKRLEIQRGMLKTSIDLTETGIGALVDADMAREAMALKAGEVKRDLGTQALSIANGRTKDILALFS
jgi:flagellin